ncbi:MAG: hypothetical protein DIU65_14665 [Proteobacteria bacterium]|nr:MAG: hypothetical protein DIU65_14665 [Pseudomonadota bacterium]
MKNFRRSHRWRRVFVMQARMALLLLPLVAGIGLLAIIAGSERYGPDPTLTSSIPSPDWNSRR